ncbi:MAG: hypothetical protein RBU29_01170 [bacterium]|nr:hypothetical protein [bacterium]
MSATSQFLLYLKALVWSVFVSYTQATVMAIAHCLREGEVKSGFPEFQDTHLGDGLRFLISALPQAADRQRVAAALEEVKGSDASLIYQNMVIEVGHYVTAKDTLQDVPTNAPGVVFCLKNNTISVLFRKPDQSLSVQTVHPFQIMPVYTLTVPD